MLEKIKEIILKVAEKHGIEVDRIILFGSRARGDFRKDSDWDILIVTKDKLDKKVEEEFWLEVGRALVKQGTVPEIIISNRDELRKLSMREKDFYLYKRLVLWAELSKWLFPKTWSWRIT